MIVFEKFCCCSLRRGTLILGYLNLIGACINFYNFTDGIQPYLILKPENVELEYYKKVANGIFYSFIAYVLILFVVNLLLIIGVHKNYKCLLMQWLIVDLIGIVIFLLAIIIGTIFLIIYEQTIFGVMFFLTMVILEALAAYFWLCVRSYYIKISDTEAQINHIHLNEKAGTDTLRKFMIL